MFVEELVVSPYVFVEQDKILYLEPSEYLRELLLERMQLATAKLLRPSIRDGGTYLSSILN